MHQIDEDFTCTVKHKCIETTTTVCRSLWFTVCSLRLTVDGLLLQNEKINEYLMLRSHSSALLLSVSVFPMHCRMLDTFYTSHKVLPL